MMILTKNKYGNFFNTRKQGEIKMAEANTDANNSVENPDSGNNKIGETTPNTQTGTQPVDNKSNYALILAVVACAIALFGKK